MSAEDKTLRQLAEEKAVMTERQRWVEKIETLALMWEHADEYADWSFADPTDGPKMAIALRALLVDEVPVIIID